MKRIFVIKGCSGSGKSTRVGEVVKYLSQALPEEILEYNNLPVALVFDKNVFIGKHTKDGRFSGYDSVTSRFGSQDKFIEFISNLYECNVFVEGAGTTVTNKLRPQYLHEVCGFDFVFMQYYNYGKENYEEYVQRTVMRTGKAVKTNSMWKKNTQFINEVKKSVAEKYDSDIVNNGLFKANIEDLLDKILEYL